MDQDFERGETLIIFVLSVERRIRLGAKDRGDVPRATVSTAILALNYDYERFRAVIDLHHVPCFGTD